MISIARLIGGHLLLHGIAQNEYRKTEVGLARSCRRLPSRRDPGWSSVKMRWCYFKLAPAFEGLTVEYRNGRPRRSIASSSHGSRVRARPLR